MRLLGNEIKKDRIECGLTQAKFGRLFAIKSENDFPDEVKQVFLGSSRDYVDHNDKRYWLRKKNLITRLEQGRALIKDVSKKDIILIAEILGKDPESYLGLEINALKFIDSISLNSKNSEIPFFERSIEFKPEYRVAGVSILSFFSEIVNKEFSNQAVKVGILQNGNSVILRVETPEGELLKEVEEVLNNYGLVVMGQMPIESVSKDQSVIQELKTRLEVTSLELRLRREASIDNSKQYEKRISSLESQIEDLHKFVGNSLVQHSNLIETIRSLSSSTQPSDTYLKALDSIINLVEMKHSEKVEKELKESLDILDNESPGLLLRLASTLESIPASIIANFATPWVQSLILTFPK